MENKMKFKIGDRVRIRQWDDMAEEFKLDNDGDIILPGTYFTKGMRHLCGKTAKIEGMNKNSIRLTSWSDDRDTDRYFTKEMLELISPTEEEVIIYRAGNYIIAEKSVNGEVIKRSVAQYDEDDVKYGNEFDFNVGAKIAFDKLLDDGNVREVKRRAKTGEWIKVITSGHTYKAGDIFKVQESVGVSGNALNGYVRVEGRNLSLITDDYVVLENYKPELLNGKFVCVETEDECLTIGKIYEFKEGFSSFDDGVKLPNPNGDDHRIEPIISLGDLRNHLNATHSRFIPLVED